MREIINISNILIEKGGILSCLINAGDPISVLMMPLIEMFQKVILIANKLPGNTEFILGSKFEERVLTMAIFSVIALLILGLLRLLPSSNESQFYGLLVKLDFVLRWNTLIPLFISLSGDIILSSLIELSLRNIFCILLIFLAFSQIYRISQRRREEDLPRWRFLFEIFSENQKFFILIYFARVILYYLVIGFFYEYPHLQAFLMILLSCGMCSYLIWLSPINKTLSKVQYLIVELALLFYNLIFWILAIFGFTDSSVTDSFGQLMNVIYLITSVITAFIIFVRILHIIYLYSPGLSSLVNAQLGHIQLSEMNQESNDRDLPPQDIRFEPLNQEEVVNSEDQNNLDSEEDIIEPSVTIE